MPQTVGCQKCAKKFKAPDELAGKKVLCPACKSPIVIPALGRPTSAGPKPQPPQPAARSAATPSPPAKTNPAPAATPCVVQCSHCAQKFKGTPQLHGRKVKCPACKSEFTVRIAGVAAPTPAASIQAKAKPTAAPAVKRPTVPTPMRPTALVTPLSKPTPPVAAKPAPAAKTSEPSAKIKRSRPRFLYFAFALAFVPLVLQTLGDRGDRKADLKQRLKHTIESHPDVQQKEDNIESLADLFALFPEGRIEGAHLSYFSRVHWLYAAIAAAAFFGAAWLLFEPGTATIWHWLVILVVTSTVGIISLIAFQWIAEVTQGFWVTGRSFIVLLFYIVKFIGFSYRAAMDESYGFWASFFGFTFGVGLCEEITKALPVLILLHNDKTLGWRSACFLGIASGVGFGVAEGIMYAGHYYNGFLPADIYFTRFISCVALHATWTAAVGVMAALFRSEFDENEAFDWIQHLLLIIAVPAILHGLYDTLLKRDMGGLALLVAVASFGWLAFMIELARSRDPVPTFRRAMPAMA